MAITVPELEPLTPGARRLLDAASALFYERGIHAVGVDVIAEAAGVTKKTLYDRFGSKEALVLSYLRHRDARWRAHLRDHLDRVDEAGPARVLAVFDAAVSYSDANTPKGCSVINARAEIGEGDDGHPLLPELRRQKTWMLDVFVDVCREAGVDDPGTTGRTMMLLYEGAIVTVGMGTFARPFEDAREVARAVLATRGA